MAPRDFTAPALAALFHVTDYPGSFASFQKLYLWFYLLLVCVYVVCVCVNAAICVGVREQLSRMASLFPSYWDWGSLIISSICTTQDDWALKSVLSSLFCLHLKYPSRILGFWSHPALWGFQEVIIQIIQWLYRSSGLHRKHLYPQSPLPAPLKHCFLCLFPAFCARGFGSTDTCAVT